MAYFPLPLFGSGLPLGEAVNVAAVAVFPEPPGALSVFQLLGKFPGVQGYAPSADAPSC